MKFISTLAGKLNLDWKRKEKIVGFVFLAPALILLFVFYILPGLMSLYYSFTSYYSLAPDTTEFVGLENFRYIFSRDIFWIALKNTFYFVALVVPLQVGIAFSLALLINNKMRGMKFFRLVFYSPVMLSLVVISILWSMLYNPDQGLLNALLEYLGFSSQPFLQSSSQAMNSIIVMSAWQGAGFQMVLFLAGLQDISKVLYEAADIDGANLWQKFRHVTLPGLYNVTTMVILTTSIFAFGIFVQPFIMTQGGPQDSTTTLIMTFYREGFQYNEVGVGSAIVLIYFVIVLAFSLLQRKVTGDRDDTTMAY